MDHGKLYADLFEAYKKANNGKPAREAQEAATSTWNYLKKSATDKHKLECSVKEKMVELATKARQKKASLMSYWCQIPAKKNRKEQEEPIIRSSPSSFTSRIEVPPGNN